MWIVEREQPHTSEESSWRNAKIYSKMTWRIWSNTSWQKMKTKESTRLNNSSLEVRSLLNKDVNFIGELINNKLLSKNVVFHCIDFLKGKPTHINLEGIVILIDKFGTFINKPDYKMKKDNLSMLNSKIDSYLADLIRVEKERKDLPGHIRYRIINLSEKQKNGWIETKVDMSQKIKTKQEVGEEFEAEQREKGNIN